MPPKKKAPLIIGGVIAAIVILALLPSEDTPPPATSTPTPVQEEPTMTPKPKPTQQQGPTEEQVTTYLAQSTGHPDLDTACLSGIRWACNIETITPRGSTLEVRVRTLEPGVDGNQAARAIHNMLTLADGTPMPELSYVQITTAQDGQVGSYRR